jgi:subunit length determinant Wzz-like protein
MQQFVEDKEVISFSSLFQVFWRWKWIIIIITLLSAMGSIFYAINQADVYRAKLIAMTPSEKSKGGFSGISGQLGGLAGLAGISLGGSSEKSLEQIKELVRSRDFLQAFIERHQLTADIIAAVGWDKSINTVIYDPLKYDVVDKKWLRPPPLGKKIIPTSWEAYPLLFRNIYIETLTKKNLLKLSIDHYSPYVAKQWVEWLIADINTLYRERAKQEAINSINFLQKSLEKASLSEIRVMLSGLLEDQMKTAMLSEVRQEFALETLSAAVLPEDKDHPKRAFIVIIGTVLGGIISLILVLIINGIFPVASKHD